MAHEPLSWLSYNFYAKHKQLSAEADHFLAQCTYIYKTYNYKITFSYETIKAFDSSKSYPLNIVDLFQSIRYDSASHLYKHLFV